ncbi:uncharacterized protein LOC111267030 isoform X1 [Varroa jacobsoni]|uniref:uncharacterized protein LOC111267030 isoform X1 n=1 Tax=Varroa jacobsoni TaxID=62625 RepID=UPI000BF3D022|nr:uncharacterized protein LOC111267030 isoform X1 [Varroa jacobsoni]
MSPNLFQMLFVPYLARLCGRSVGGRGFRPLLLVLFASVALAIFAYSRSLQNSQVRFSGTSQPLVISYRINTPSCRIPEFSPFDFTVGNLYERRSDPVCPGPPSFLKWTSYNILQLDIDVLSRQYADLTTADVKCTFQELFRNQSLPEPDKVAFLGDPQELVFGEELNTEFILIECRYHSRVVLQEYAMVPVLKDDVEHRVQTIESKGVQVSREANVGGGNSRTNVLVLGIDSVSYLNAYRHLRQSLAYIRTQLDSIELKGYVKVGDNSFPNQNPLINGLTEDEAMSYKNKGFFDMLTDQMIWSEYVEFGYRSLFLEESAHFGLFHYHFKGFHKAPVDYYTRPMVMTVETSPLTHALGEHVFCHGGRTTSEMYLNYIERFAAMMTAREANFFAYVWLSDISHNEMNSVGSLDAILTRHLRALDSGGVLNNTALIFLSDHGIRFDKIRSTTVGKYEDRMPFAFVAMPHHFCETHHVECQNLKINSARLTTHFDMHATFRHLLHLGSNSASSKSSGGSSSSTSDVPTRTKRGQSLFSEVPINRSCEAASIDTMWCTCAPDQDNGKDHSSLYPLGEDLSVTGKLAKRLGLVLEERLNDIIDHNQCYHLSLNHVIEMQRAQGPAPHHYYWLTASFSPGNSIFEATIILFQNGTLTTSKGISRCNMYWGTTWCVADHWMEKFCHCKSWYTTLYLMFIGG